MSQDIIAMFLPRFVTNARGYIAGATAATERRDPAALAGVVRNMHSIAGEAGLLGFRELVALAREGEARAQRLAAEPSDHAAAQLTDAIARLATEVDALVARHPAR
jgi:HPt (histidine-containing phosphotransfer) domain-containing protein